MLKNFTIMSLVLIVIGFLPSVYPLENFGGFFSDIFVIGFWCFLFAYFLYAVKCWGSDGKVCAILMLTLPLLTYFLATTEILASTGNIWLNVFIQFCLYAIISAVILYIGDNVRNGISRYLFRKNQRYSYFYPKLTYLIVGVVLVSFFALNLGSIVVFSNNFSVLSQSIQQENDNTVLVHSPVMSASDTYVTVSPTGAYQFTPTPTLTPVNYRQSPKTISYPYLCLGNRETITFTSYGGLANHFSKEGHSYYHDFEQETLMELLVNNDQDEYFDPLIAAIKKRSGDPDVQAKIAISLVQHIPYNWNAYYARTADWYYPYETIYNNKGVCADKSLLLAYLLNRLGYDTVLFEFSDHMAVGAKSSSNYDFYDSGYAFIETTRPTIITYIPDTYYGGFTITPNPNIIHLNGGTKSLDVSIEYRDGIRLKQLESMGQILDQTNYNEWLRISNYYNTQYET